MIVLAMEMKIQCIFKVGNPLLQQDFSLSFCFLFKRHEINYFDRFLCFSYLGPENEALAICHRLLCSSVILRLDLSVRLGLFSS